MADRKELTRATCNEGQLRCWDAVAWAFGGDHHLPRRVYECGRGIEMSVTGEFATHDGNMLTRLVAVAHATQVRIAIEGGSPFRTKVFAHPRDKDAASTMEGHKTIAQLIEYLKRFDEMKGGAK